MDRAQPETLPLFGRRILVADDSPAARMILQGILERAGAAVTAVADGEDVVERVRSAAQRYDAIVLDVEMERTGGIQAAKHVRALPEAPTSAIVFASARIDEQLRRGARDVEAFSDFLVKPFAGSEVVRVVCAALGTALGAGPARVAAVQPAVEPHVPGCDLAGALDRCGGDHVTLLGLQRQLEDEAGRRLSIAAQAIRGRLYRIARGELHRIRGDLLNLGFLEIGARLGDIEKELVSFAAFDTAEPGTTVPSGLLESGTRLADEMADLKHELGIIVARVRQLPAMTASQPAEPARSKLGETAFTEFVSALESDALAAVRAIDLRNRVLPERYTDSTDRDFRIRMARLDFPGALQLLDAADRNRSLPVTGSGYRILVVDDMPSAVLLLCGMIESIGHVRFALTGERALKIAETWTPDLVIADVHLGGMSGLELCRALKASSRTADAAVVLVSADSDIAIEVEGLTAGASDFLSKPLNPARVVGRVNAQLAGLRRISATAAAIAGDASSAALGFVTSTHAGAVIDVSPRIARELEAAGASLTGRALRELFEPGSAAAVDLALRDVAARGRAAPFEASLRGADGTPIPVRVVGWSAPGAAARIAWLSVEDRRDRLSSERQRLEDELSRTIGVMAGGMAHEFNNLLNVAIGNVDLLLEAGLADGLQRERLSRANAALVRAAEISRRLGDFGLRGETARGLQTLDQLLDQVWPFVANTVPAGVVVLRERAAEEVPLKVDSRGFRSAISNLLQNSYDAMPGGGQVTVRARVRREPGGDGPIAVLEVADTGSGMSEAVRLRAFEPFFTTRLPARTGLGLTQVRGFVQRNKGTIHIESAPGAGTTVRVEFDA